MPKSMVSESHLSAGQSDHMNTEQIDTVLFSYVLVQCIGLSAKNLNTGCVQHPKAGQNTQQVGLLDFRFQISTVLLVKFSDEPGFRAFSVQIPTLTSK